MPGSNYTGFFGLGAKTADDHADDLRDEMAQPKKELTYAAMPDPTQVIRSAGNYVSKKMGGPSLDPAFDALDLFGSVKTLGTKNPTMLGRRSPVGAKVDAVAGASRNPLLEGLKTTIAGPAPKPYASYQPTQEEADLLRGMMVGLRGGERLPTKAYQPMQY